jgi:class 3 adenylate cyclase/tetratricopeptide (TPR) repeat protein
MTCQRCGAELTPGKKFCGSCGAPITAAERADRFASPESYTPKHLAEKILTSKDAMEGERKIITVMFSDVSGFTAMSERLDPEEVHAIMDRAFEVILNVVHHYEGTINQFLGDGVMALFGAPIAHEDHAHRALAAALDIQKGLLPLADDVRRMHSVEFRMRMGINTGLVVVGAIGKDLRMDYTAVGDTTNLAARFLGLAKPGQIVVSQRTQQLRGQVFAFEDLGEFQVKGKAEPVRAYALIAQRQGGTILEASKERTLTPLIGRDRELGRLEEAFRRASGGGGAVVLLSGEPGVGKSRLLYEFLGRLAGTGILEIETTCASYGHSIPYRPILELLRHYLGLLEAPPAAEIRQRIAERLHELDLGGEEPAILLAHFTGVSAPPEFISRLSGAELRERTFALLRDLFLRASRSGPLVLLIENVHWIDRSSVEFLGHLAAGLPGHSILLLLSTRPGIGPSLTLPAMETISVESLDGAEVERMTQTLLATEAVSPELTELLAEKSAGNPLYVEEILHQLKETGGVVVEGGEARLRGAKVKVPATIHDIIAARVDRLVEPLKLSLQGAAVVGRRFGTQLVSRVVGIAVDDQSHHLRDLHRLDFVFPSADEPELMFSFKHALTQDVVYTGLLERRRRRYHAAVGRGLEELYAGHIDGMVELLAHHFGASAEDEKAVDYALLSADKAQRRWANQEALAYFQGALTRLHAMPDTEANRARRIDAIVKQAEIMFALGRHAEHIQTLEGIKDLVAASTDPVRRAAWYYWTGFLHSLTGARPDIPIAYCLEASAIAAAAGLDEIRASADCCLCHVYAYAGRLREALAAGERALPVFEARGNAWWACRTLWGLSLTAIPLGQWETSLQYCRRALEHGQAGGDRRLQVVGWWRTGWTHIQRGEVDPGIRCCEEALALSPSPFDAAMARAVLGYGLVKVGKAETGIGMLAEAVEWFDRSHLVFTRTWYAIWLADAYLRAGDAANARRLGEEVLARSQERGYRYFEGMAERLLGTALASVEPAVAALHIEAALRILEEVGARNEVAKVLMASGQLRRDAGDLAGARAVLEEALAIFEELGTLDEPPRVKAILDSLVPAP